MFHIAPDVLVIQCPQLEANHYSLVELSHRRRGEHVLQLWLSYKDDLDQLLLLCFQVREHSDLLKNGGGEVLGLIYNENSVTSLAEVLKQELIDLVDALLLCACCYARIYAKLLNNDLQKFLLCDERVEDKRALD